MKFHSDENVSCKESCNRMIIRFLSPALINFKSERERGGKREREGKRKMEKERESEGIFYWKI